LQKQMIHSAKLASIGELAAGIAHEINNPLAIVSGATELIESKFHRGKLDQAELEKQVRRSRQSIERISRIVKGLRSYARSDTSDVEVVDARRAIDEGLGMLESVFAKSAVELETDFCSEVALFDGDYGKLQQIITNLLTNARDAILENSDEGVIKVKVSTDHANVIIKVQDDGPGIAEGKLERIFDAFFTTKKTGKGTGLGLSIVDSLVTDMGGAIDVESKVGVGTTFTMTFPLAEPAEREEAA
jgi:signal transduction histidine kinase